MIYNQKYKDCKECSGYTWQKMCYYKNPIDTNNPVCIWYSEMKTTQKVLNEKKPSDLELKTRERNRNI